MEGEQHGIFLTCKQECKRNLIANRRDSFRSSRSTESFPQSDFFFTLLHSQVFQLIPVFLGGGSSSLLPLFPTIGGSSAQLQLMSAVCFCTLWLSRNRRTALYGQVERRSPTRPAPPFWLGSVRRSYVIFAGSDSREKKKKKNKNMKTVHFPCLWVWASLSVFSFWCHTCTHVHTACVSSCVHASPSDTHQRKLNASRQRGFFSHLWTVLLSTCAGGLF